MDIRQQWFIPSGNSLGGAWEIVLDALEVLHGILYSGSSIEDAGMPFNLREILFSMW